MPNPLLSFVPPVQAAKLYQTIRYNLGYDHHIFLAMERVSQRRRSSAFVLPTSADEYDEKHDEIEQALTRYQTVLNRQGLFFELMEEIHAQLMDNQLEVHAERMRGLVILETNEDFKIRLNEDGAWLIEWNVADDNKIIVIAYRRDWEHVIPWPVIEYLNSGISLYKRGAFTTALALMSIAVEATIRDVLSTKGYSFKRGVSKEDVYEYSKARVTANGTDYRLSFVDRMPKTAADLTISANEALPIDIEVRRKLNTNKSRIDLVIRTPRSLIDHWSSDKVTQQGDPKIIGGLGEALCIARQRENVVTSRDMPPDVDKVLQAVRNNLIHLSQDSMDEHLPEYDFMTNGRGIFTVQDFVNHPELVFDLVTNIPRFVNDQYVKLWKAGERI